MKAHRPAAIVLLGDVQATRPLHDELADILALTQVAWIPGNHDADSRSDFDHLFNSALAATLLLVSLWRNADTSRYASNLCTPTPLNK